jgi:hypothetical protein
MAGVKKAKVKRVKAPKVKPVKRVVAKRTVKAKAIKKVPVKPMTAKEKARSEFTVVQRREFETKTYIRESFKKPHILDWFRKRGGELWGVFREGILVGTLSAHIKEGTPLRTGIFDYLFIEPIGVCSIIFDDCGPGDCFEYAIVGL